MLRNRTRPYDHRPSRREVKRLALEEEELDIADLGFWEDVPFDNLEGPTDQELREIEAEEYEPEIVVRGLDDLPVVADREEDYNRGDEDRYRDY